jgi:hypothetical protein
MQNPDGRMSSISTYTAWPIAIRGVTYRHDPCRDIKSKCNRIRVKATEPPPLLGYIRKSVTPGSQAGSAANADR